MLFFEAFFLYFIKLSAGDGFLNVAVYGGVKIHLKLVSI